MANITWNEHAEMPALQKLWKRVDRKSKGESPRMSPDDVIAACDEFVSLFPGEAFKSGHIVLSDLNTELSHIAWCIRQCIEALEISHDYDGSEDEVIHFLACLAELDDSERIVHEQELEAS